MLKLRVIPTLLHRHAGLVKSVRFAEWRNLGNAIQAVRVYNTRQVDELVFLDIEAREPNLSLIREVADECFMPLAVGGGIRTLDHVRQVLRVGADKVVINTAAIDDPKFIASCTKSFGAQCVVVSIDVAQTGDGYEVRSRRGLNPTGLDPVVWAQRCEALGAGEIYLTAIDRDGTMQGYDLELIHRVSQAVAIPVIASGGAGKVSDFISAVQLGGASAVAAASIFHFTQVRPMSAKREMAKQGIEVRLT
jgi:cyclase